MTDTKYPVKLELRIDWSELDYFGHVNNVSFFKYIQASRVHYWDQVGLTASHRKTNIGPMLASSKCDFKKPLFYPGKAIVHAKVSTIGNTSFSIQHRIENENGDLVALAEDTMVMYDFNKEEKYPFPADLRERIEQLEGKKF